MNPSKIRERKCSTCKHYQPSPLWRKGWCRNPLLYDRNTNHLVEADSLACNRTFIDYWEPIVGPAPTATTGTTGRATRPRIAPSIPMEMTDSRGQRVTRTGITPMQGMSAVTAEEVNDALTADELAYAEASDLDYEVPSTGQSTMELAQLDRDLAATNGAATGPVPAITRAGETVGTTASKKTKAARQPQPPIIFGMGRDRLILIGVAALLILIAIAAGSMLLRQPGTVENLSASPTVTVAPEPSPTGFGDPTATVPPEPTVTPAPPPPSDVIAVGGYVEATSNVVVRSEPTTAGARLGVLQTGTKAHVIEGPQEANGFTWWKVDGFDPNNPQASGWCAGEFLKPIPPP